MAAESANSPLGMQRGTHLERKSDRELVITRTINGPARLVFEAFRKAELFQRWWVPKSFGITLLSCEVDVRVGGKYKLVFAHGDASMEFFGTYLEVVPNERIAWTNEESPDGPVTTVTFEEKAGKTLLVMRELHPSKEALDAALESGSCSGMGETLEQLDELVGTLLAS